MTVEKNLRCVKISFVILGPKELLKLVKKIKLVENLSERELTNPEGAGFDLRLGRVYKLKGKGFLGVDERKTPDVKLIAQFNPKKKSSIIIKPGQYFLTETFERLNMPINLVGIVKPRTTLHRSGIITRVSIADPGYNGTLHPGIFNAGGVPVEIELGARYVNIMFFEIKGEGSHYRGQWQGGRVAATKKEKQV